MRPGSSDGIAGGISRGHRITAFYRVQLPRDWRDFADSGQDGEIQAIYGAADYERQNPVFKEATKLFITPMISSLSIMTLADNGSESEVLGLGISVIALNLGMYVAAPAMLIYKARKFIRI